MGNVSGIEDRYYCAIVNSPVKLVPVVHWQVDQTGIYQKKCSTQLCLCLYEKLYKSAV